MSNPVPEEKMAALAELISRGKKIEAIKLFRELTGLGLKEAKEAIEALEASLGGSTPDKFAASPNVESAPGPAALLPEDKMDALAGFIFQGRKIEAIKYYRECTRVGLREAKDRVETLETSLRARAPEKFVAAPQRKGCLGAAALLCLCGAVICYWVARR